MNSRVSRTMSKKQLADDANTNKCSWIDSNVMERKKSTITMNALLLFDNKHNIFQAIMLFLFGSGLCICVNNWEKERYKMLARSHFIFFMNEN